MVFRCGNGPSDRANAVQTYRNCNEGYESGAWEAPIVLKMARGAD